MSDKEKLYLLDTSAMIAMIEAEDGGQRVRDLLSRANVIIPFVALLELRYITLRERGQAEADLRYAAFKQTRARILWEMDEPTLLVAARLKVNYPISLGDSLIAALAAAHHAVLVHKDPELTFLRDELAMETLSLKKVR